MDLVTFESPGPSELIAERANQYKYLSPVIFSHQWHISLCAVCFRFLPLSLRKSRRRISRENAAGQKKDKKSWIPLYTKDLLRLEH